MEKHVVDDNWLLKMINGKNSNVPFTYYLELGVGKFARFCAVVKAINKETGKIENLIKYILVPANEGVDVRECMKNGELYQEDLFNRPIIDATISKDYIISSIKFWQNKLRMVEEIEKAEEEERLNNLYDLEWCWTRDLCLN